MAWKFQNQVDKKYLDTYNISIIFTVYDTRHSLNGKVNDYKESPSRIVYHF